MIVYIELLFAFDHVLFFNIRDIQHLIPTLYNFIQWGETVTPKMTLENKETFGLATMGIVHAFQDPY